MAALADLPPRQRACVVLRYYEDLSVEAVAEALGCRAGTVKSQTARGLDALRSGVRPSRRRAALSTLARRPRDVSPPRRSSHEHRAAHGAARRRVRPSVLRPLEPRDVDRRRVAPGPLAHVAAVLGAAALATVAAIVVTAGVVSRSAGPDPDPGSPQSVVRLDLESADEPLRLDVLAHDARRVGGRWQRRHLVRTTVSRRSPDDGLVLVQPHRSDRPHRRWSSVCSTLAERRDGLAAATWGGQPRRSERSWTSTSERLVARARSGGAYGYVRWWSSTAPARTSGSGARSSCPAGVEVHVAPQLALGTRTDAALPRDHAWRTSPDPVRWWSAPVTGREA